MTIKLTPEQETSIQRKIEGDSLTLRAEYIAMFENLTETQARCTALIQEARAAAKYIVELEFCIKTRTPTWASSFSELDNQLGACAKAYRDTLGKP